MSIRTVPPRNPFQPSLVKIDMPKELHDPRCENDYFEEAYEVDSKFIEDTYDTKVVMVKYTPILSSEKHGFAVFFLMERNVLDDGDWLPCSMTQGMWFEIAMSSYCGGHTYTADSTGRIRGKNGIPDNCEIQDVTNKMIAMYLKWRHFPDKARYDDVCKLYDAKKSVDDLRTELHTNIIKNRIEKSRAEIVELKNKISTLENRLTEVYEKAADGINLLEKEGYSEMCNLEKPEDLKKETIDSTIERIVAGY